jgi:recombination protein RecR
MKTEYPAPIRELVLQLKRLPGIGPRSAERIALWMVQSRNARLREISEAIARVEREITPCTDCGFFTADAPLCGICRDPARDPHILCVVEQATDIPPLERTGKFAGRYHALGGRISPLDHIGPGDLRIESLLRRIANGSGTVSEVVLALSSDVEGEATSRYIADELSGKGVLITRIAQGLPASGGLEHADELTISRALSGRTVWR